MGTNVIATIDVSRPAGRKLVRELEGKRCVELDYPITAEMETAIANENNSHVTVWKNIEKKFNEHYGTNIRFI
jgi:hypothetical protein